MTETQRTTDTPPPSCVYDQFPLFSHPKFRMAMAILEKISLVALAAFAAYSCPKLFFPFFGFGVLLGGYLYWDKKNVTHHQHGHEEGGGCSQGFLEELTGVRLPPPLGLAVNVAMTYCHIEHHTHIFAPIIGLNFGMWVGKLAGEYIPYCYRQLFQTTPPPEQVQTAV